MSSRALFDRWKADRIVAHRWVEPFARERDRRIGEAVGAAFSLYEGETLLPPGTLRTAAGSACSVFTPFALAFRRTARVGPALPAPRSLPPLPRGVTARPAALPTCESLAIARNPRLLAGGERAGRTRLRRFLRDAARDHADQRDRLDRPGTSPLSADLKFGTLSVRAVWNAVAAPSTWSSTTPSYPRPIVDHRVARERYLQIAGRRRSVDAVSGRGTGGTSSPGR